ncbi:hypothetical protein L1987_01035 [Smallanthus sonchifolius]|uniref:Uncharacterized protein n=1 Tax=Smallanthus sonchifolius TaxID=185202 RepID=A0ACB9K3Z3_9ASTR|nr:hypothetical protein L1987_01035 [Smallanthus sonchifolius]
MDPQPSPTVHTSGPTRSMTAVTPNSPNHTPDTTASPIVVDLANTMDPIQGPEPKVDSLDLVMGGDVGITWKAVNVIPLHDEKEEDIVGSGIPRNQSAPGGVGSSTSATPGIVESEEESEETLLI